MLLAFDTAMAACSAALYDASRNRVIASRFVRMERGHAEALAPMILEVMDEAGIGFSGLARIGVTIGPGTFTGVRTSVAMARGFALALGIPIIGLDTLTAIAANVADDGRPLVVAADARRGEVYFSLHDPEKLQTFRKKIMRNEVGSLPVVIPIAEAGRRLPEGEVSIIGTGSEAVIEAASRSDIHRLRDGDVPDSAKFARLCATREPKDGPVEPLYLRPADARPQTGPRSAASSIAIRTASSSESPILAAMHRECFDNPWGTAEFAKLMAMPGALSLIAMDGDEPVAFLLARQAADEAEILTIGTRPFARRRGIARRLMANLAASLPNVTSLFIEVAHGNRAAKGLYDAEGFKVAGKRRAYYETQGRAREDAIVMMKALIR